MKQENNADESTNKPFRKELNEVESITHKINTENKYKIYRCKHCSLCLKDSYNLKRHIEQKICVRNKFNCRKKFDNITEEIVHVTKFNCLECLICKTTSKSYGSFIQHRLRHTTKHRENRKTLPWEHHIGCQMCQISLSKRTIKAVFF